MTSVVKLKKPDPSGKNYVVAADFVFDNLGGGQLNFWVNNGKAQARTLSDGMAVLLVSMSNGQLEMEHVSEDPPNTTLKPGIRPGMEKK